MPKPALPNVPLTVRTAKWQLAKRGLKLVFYACSLGSVSLLLIEQYLPGISRTPVRLSVPQPTPSPKPPPAPSPPPLVAMPESRAVQRTKSPRPKNPEALVVKGRGGPRPRLNSPTSPTQSKGRSLRMVDWIKEIKLGEGLGNRFWKFTTGNTAVPEKMSPPEELPSDGDLGAIVARGGGLESEPPTEMLPPERQEGVIMPTGGGAPDVTLAGRAAAEEVRRAKIAEAEAAYERWRQLWIMRLQYGGGFTLLWFLFLLGVSGLYRPLLGLPQEQKKEIVF
jgi:hypothetical protein